MVDGAARGNPGDAGGGAVIIDQNGIVVKKLSRYLGRPTNNVAEYEGLLMGLEGSAATRDKHRGTKRFPALGAVAERGTRSKLEDSKDYFAAPSLCCGNSTRIVFSMCLAR